LNQCFGQSAPLQESCVTSRYGPQKNKKRANLALFFNKTAGLTQAYILKAIQGLQIVIDTIANATSISPLATKNSGFVAIIWHHGDYISLC